jgi:tRNA-2-methylthio-N6-dimethylallyladenosine synthase
MNVADSQRVGSSLEHLGYTFTETIEEADVIVLNTCVVRQSQEMRHQAPLRLRQSAAESRPGHQPDGMPGRCAHGKCTETALVDVFSSSDPGPCLIPARARSARWKIPKRRAAS